MNLLSGDALQKFSPVSGFSHRDHPVDAVAHKPLRVSIGSVGIIALTQTKVDWISNPGLTNKERKLIQLKKLSFKLLFYNTAVCPHCLLLIN